MPFANCSKYHGIVQSRPLGLDRRPLLFLHRWHSHCSHALIVLGFSVFDNVKNTFMAEQSPIPGF